VAVDVEHPCWEVAMSRLGDTGNGFTTAFTRDTIGARALVLEREQGVILARELGRIRGRQINWSSELKPLLERAAWAKLMGKPYADKLVLWTLDQVRAHNQTGALRTLLQGLAKEYVPSEVVSDRRQELGTRVRGWAEKLALPRAR